MKDLLLDRAKALRLYGSIAHWEEVSQLSWLRQLIEWEEQARSNRSLERRLFQAKLGRFKPLAEFDWNWPSKCDREAIEELMELNFMASASNIILCGPNGVGKTTIACNIAHEAAVKGHTVLFVTAGEMLDDLASQNGDHALARRLKYYEKPDILCCDEIGYSAYSNGHGDLLFAVISRRYQKKSTLISTNKAFNEWGQVFPNATCVVSLIDRLLHHSEIISIEARSFRLKESQEAELSRKKVRAQRKSKKTE
jgi:DNA replication protein DnaC